MRRPPEINPPLAFSFLAFYFFLLMSAVWILWVPGNRRVIALLRDHPPTAGYPSVRFS